MFIRKYVGLVYGLDARVYYNKSTLVITEYLCGIKADIINISYRGHLLSSSACQISGVIKQHLSNYAT